MISLKENIKTIEKLVAENTPQSLTYAVLECRLAIEEVCYERLRIDHDYISLKEQKGWQPKAVMNFLIENVNPQANITQTLEMSKHPTVEKNSSLTTEEYAAEEYVTVGTQIGFSITLISSIWHGLGNMLHAVKPNSKDDVVSRYHKSEKTCLKIQEALAELRKLSQGTLVMGGIGKVVSIDCSCGTSSKRRLDFLTNGQVVNCAKLKCEVSWTALVNNDEVNFERREVSIKCLNCSKICHIDERFALSIGLNKVGGFSCDCGQLNHIGWKLMSFKKL